ncbi:MAG: hypothetical protein K2M94_04875 [Paramuribaculum sp.]|nr:hypothetical protein [Paramuribaculum sp.]
MFKKKFKYYSLVVSMFLVITTFISCSDDSNEEPQVTMDLKKEFSDNFFSVGNGLFSEEKMPSGNPNGEPIYGLDLNDKALSGGMNFITIQTPQNFDKFMIGVKGEKGFWTVDANSSVKSSSSRAGLSTYVIPLNFGIGYNTTIIIIIIAIDNDGNVTQPTEEEIGFVESKSGDLNVNLTFSNAKDVDLHLYTPSGNHIYYANRGYVIYDDKGNYMENGLDHDSNAGCSIDNLNNENIFIPEELIETGEYTVKVNMFSNCDPTVATYWSIIARYNGEIIQPLNGSNPAVGVYDVNAGNGDFTEVMKFTISEVSSSTNRKSRAIMYEALPLTESARKKLSSN